MTQLLPLAQVRPSDRQVGQEARDLARLARLGIPVLPSLVLRHAAWLAYLAAYNAEELWTAFCRQPDDEHAAPLRCLLAEQGLHAELRSALHLQLARHVDAVELTSLPAPSGLRPIYTLRLNSPAIDEAQVPEHLSVDAASLDSALRAAWTVAIERWAAPASRQAATSPMLSVLVQAIPPLDCAGKLQTVTPDNPDSLLVTAVWGLAEPLYSTQTRPDRWLLARAGGRLLHHEPGARQEAAWPTADGIVPRPLPERAPAPLSPITLDTLRILGLQIEHVLGGPLSITWAHNGRRFWIGGVQSAADQPC